MTMQRWAPVTATREVQVELVAPGEGTVVPLPMVLHYDSADPFAVHATFRTGKGEGVCWVFARDLLTLGVHRPTGDGDVRVWPSSAGGREVVYIGLNSPDGEALLQAPSAAVIDFLGRSYAIVAHGKERDYLDVDRVIEALLAS
jgi:hypothetical protein